MTALALVGLAGRTAAVRAGHLRYAGRDLFGFAERDCWRMRGRDVGLMVQNALVSLNVLRFMGRKVGEALQLHRAVATRSDLAVGDRPVGPGRDAGLMRDPFD